MPFFTSNRSRKLAEPTYDHKVIAETADDLLLATGDDRPGMALRGRGVGWWVGAWEFHASDPHRHQYRVWDSNPQVLSDSGV